MWGTFPAGWFQWCCLHLCITWELPRAWKIHVLYKFNFRIEMWFSRHQISGTHCIHHNFSKLASSLPYSPQKYNVTCYSPTQDFQNFLEINCSLIFFFRDCHKSRVLQHRWHFCQIPDFPFTVLCLGPFLFLQFSDPSTFCSYLCVKASYIIIWGGTSCPCFISFQSP